MDIKLLNKDFFDENENFRAFFDSAHRENSMKSNEFWELLYVYEGQGKFYTDNGVRTIKDGDFVFIKSGVHYCVTSPSEKDGAVVRMCRCIFTDDYFEILMKKYSAIEELKNYTLYDILSNKKTFCIQLSDDNAQNIRHLMWLTAHEYNHFTDASEMIISHTMLDLLIIITRLYEYDINKAVPTVSRNDEIDNLMKYMRSNFGYKLTLEFLSSRMHISREYLSRYFKQYTGKTVYEFLTEIRISKAKQMLETSSHSIGDIGAYCGYPSVTNFQKAFKKETGMSPNQYRKSKRKTE